MGQAEEAQGPLRLRVEKLVAGGLGLARHEGRVVLIEEAAPGDLLEARVVGSHRGWLRARPLRVLEPGPGRRVPPCPHAARCGGCSLQHLTYPAQLEAKVAILRESFARTARLALPAPEVHASPEWGYRRRARFHVARSGGRPRLGFYSKRGHQVIDIGPCPVLTPRLEASLGALRERSRAAEVQALDAEHGVVAGRSAEPARVRVGADLLLVEPGLFFQANAPLLDPLVARVAELAAGAARPSRLLELYAGIGLFTLALARRFQSVTAVEGVERAARLLAANLRAAGLGNVRVAATSAEEAVAVPGALDGIAAAVVDPPREGLSRPVRRALGRARLERLVYVACDPVALARDAAELAAAGMGLESVDLFDLFPQTHHFETVAVLARPALL